MRYLFSFGNANIWKTFVKSKLFAIFFKERGDFFLNLLYSYKYYSPNFCLSLAIASSFDKICSIRASVEIGDGCSVGACAAIG